MSGHSKWVPGTSDAVTSVEMRAYCQGYILAVEDILGDLEGIDHGGRGGYYSMDYFAAIEAVEESLKDTLSQAKRTLENLK